MKKTLIFAAVLIQVSTIVRAGTFDDIVGMIAAGSTEIAVATKDHEAVVARAACSSNLADPEIEGEYLFGRQARDRWSAGVSQSFDWPGVYSARRDAAMTRARASSMRLEATAGNIACDVRQLMIDYINACKCLETLAGIDSSLTVIEQMIKIDNGRQMTRLDLNKIKVERGLLKSRVATCEDDRLKSLSALSAISPGVDVEALLSAVGHDYPSDRLLDLSSYLQEADNDSRVLALKLEADAAAGEVSVTGRERYPGFSLGYVHAFEDGAHFNGFSVGMSIPVFSTRHKMAVARVDLMAAETKWATTLATIKADVVTNYERASALRQSLDELAPVFEIYDNIALLTRAYKGGEINLIQLLTETNFFIDSRLQYLDLQYKYQSSLTALHRYVPSRDF